jgi:hypothetical protein
MVCRRTLISRPIFEYADITWLERAGQASESVTAVRKSESFMTGRALNTPYSSLLAFPLVAAAFATGWLASRHVVISSAELEQESAVCARGDAPEGVRQSVIETLRDFQDGYVRRDVKTLHAFMRRIIPDGKDCLVMGTEPGEWIRGYDRIERFIRNDWLHWGDVRLDVDAPEISGSGDVAWLATPGTVTIHESRHPFRFTATVVRENGRWMFRQMQFQWDEKRGTSLREVFRLSNLVRLRWQ